MTDKVIVLGGSFNPPTRAHLILMQAALDAIDACKGVFVPTSHEYVAKKMKRQGRPDEILNESTRLAMLESFRKYDDRFAVNRLRMMKPECGYDFEMLMELQKELPGAEIYFVVGSDKLYPLPRWRRIDELLDQFRVLVAKRGEDDLAKIKQIKPYLAERWDRFEVFDAPPEINDISSSAFRERLRNNDETAKELVTPEVWEIMSATGRAAQESITDFHAEEYRFLSNFYEVKIKYGAYVFSNAEAAFQAQKCLSEGEKAQFMNYGAGKSKAIGRRVKLRHDWEDVKLGIMEDVVRAKFRQNPDLAAKLLATGDKRLVEGNTWGDVFWGVDVRSGRGKNHLGQILMKVRDELKSTS